MHQDMRVHTEYVTSPHSGCLFSDGMKCRERGDAVGRQSGAVVKEDNQAGKRHEQPLRCLLCAHAITSVSARFKRDDTHLHTFFNPAGIVYEIGCFQRAPGCVAHGPASDDFSWFSGYVWRVAFCRFCLTHLGWHYASDFDDFFGLIINRLRHG